MAASDGEAATVLRWGVTAPLVAEDSATGVRRGSGRVKAPNVNLFRTQPSVKIRG